MFLPYITSQFETVSRVDIVWDRYLTHSLKQSTMDRRTHSGTTQRQRVIRRCAYSGELGGFPEEQC